MTDTVEEKAAITGITLGLPITALCITPATEQAVDPADLNRVVADMLVRGVSEAHVYDLNGVFLAAVPSSDGLLKLFVAQVRFSIDQTEPGSDAAFSGYIFVNPIKDDGRAGYESAWSRTLAYQRGESLFTVMDAMYAEGVTKLTLEQY